MYVICMLRGGGGGGCFPGKVLNFDYGSSEMAFPSEHKFPIIPASNVASISNLAS